MSTRTSGPGVRLPRVLIGFGGLLALTMVSETLVRVLVASDGIYTNTFGVDGAYLIGVFSSIPFVVGLGAAGYWLAHERISTDRYARVARWCWGTAVGFVLLNAVAMLVTARLGVWQYVAWARWALAIGAGTGVLIGVIEAWGIETALRTQRARVRADALEAQRDLLDYLNGLLRHEVLNSVGVIDGYASLLTGGNEPETEEYRYGETISRQSRELQAVIEDVRVLLAAAQGTPEFVTVSLHDLLVEEAVRIEATHDAVEIDVAVPEGTTVAGDSLLRRVFANLLSNAVEHDDGPATRVSVRATEGADTVAVTVEDDGPGLPDHVVDTLFQRPETHVNHGLGLYLVRTLVTYYGGEIELVETGADGTVFRVELPRRAGPDAADGSGSAARASLTAALRGEDASGTGGPRRR